VADSLNGSAYAEAMNKIAFLAMLAADLPLEAMEATLAVAHERGPVEYPEDYQRAVDSGSMAAQTDAIAAVRALLEAIARIPD